MWKDFFYFSKGERKAIVFLLGMIVTIIGVWLVSPYLIEESSKETGQESFEEMERFLIQKERGCKKEGDISTVRT